MNKIKIGVALLATVMIAALAIGVTACKEPEGTTTPVITINTQPAATSSVMQGDTTKVLSVSASVTEGATLSYQWYSNTTASNQGGTAISGATAAVFPIPSADDGTFHYFVEVRATGGAASVRSNVATVNVTAPTAVITIDAEPQDKTVNATNTAAELAVTASVEPAATLRYQWFSNTAESYEGGTVISGATNASYTTPGGLSVGDHFYYCEISADDASTERTRIVKVTVSTLPLLNISNFTAADKTVTYNRSTHSVTVSFAGSELNETLTGAMTVHYQGTGGTDYDSTTAPANAGTYNVMVSTAGSTNYAPFAKTKIAELKINPLQLTWQNANGTVSPKVYDGNTTATIATLPTLDGVIASDTVTVTATVVFSNKNANASVGVTVSDYGIEGADAGNYIKPAATPTFASAAITKKTITITGVTAVDRPANNTTTVQLTGGSLQGVVDGDNVQPVLGTGTIANNAVGNDKTVTTTITLSGTDAGNYNLTQPTGITVNISQPDAVYLTITGVSAVNRAYNGTNIIELTGTGASLVGVEDGDTIGFTLGNGTIADANVGNGKTVITSITLTGNTLGKYILTQPTLTVNITPKQLTWLDANGTVTGKTYDGNTTAAIATLPTLDGVEDGDTVTVTATVVFSDKNAGGSIGVTVTDYGIAGADAGNYTKPAATPTFANAAITAKPLTWGANGTVESKPYDKTTAAAIATLPTLTGVIAGDNVTVTPGTVTFASVNAGINIAVTAEGFGDIGGTDALNYTAPAGQPAFTAGTITARPITITPDSGQSRHIGSTSDPALTYTVTSGTVIDGDTSTGALSRATGEDEGEYEITQGTLSYGSNYAITFTTGVMFTIGHNWSDWTVTIPKADCYTEGEEERTCTFNGDTHTETRIIPAGHTIENGRCTECGIFTTVPAVRTYLQSQPTNTVETPYTIKMSLEVNFNFWASTQANFDIYTVLNTSGIRKYVNLDLSECWTLDSTIPHRHIRGGNWDVAQRGQQYIVELVLPSVAITTTTEGAPSAIYPALFRHTNITKISGAVTSIGERAFIGNTNVSRSLKEVDFPNVTEIGREAFRYQDVLTTAHFPSVTRLGEFAFGDCASLTTVTLGDIIFFSSVPSTVFDKCPLYRVTLGTISETVWPTGTGQPLPGNFRVAYFNSFSGGPGTYIRNRPTQTVEWTRVVE